METENGFTARYSNNGEIIKISSLTQADIDDFADRIWPQRTTSGDRLWTSFVSLGTTDFGYGVKQNEEFYVIDPRSRFQQSASETLIRKVRISEDNKSILGLSGPVPASAEEFIDTDVDCIEYKHNLPIFEKDFI